MDNSLLKHFITESIYSIDEHNPEIRFLGSNAGKIGIIIHEAHSDYVNDSDLDFLNKVLASVKLSMDDVALFNEFHHSITSIDSEFDFKIVVMMGVSIDPYEFEYYHILENKGTKYLKTDSLEKIQQSVELKKKLWKKLKELFYIS